jgi:hypothetical protein
VEVGQGGLAPEVDGRRPVAQTLINGGKRKDCPGHIPLRWTIGFAALVMLRATKTITQHGRIAAHSHFVIGPCSDFSVDLCDADP